MKSHLAELLCSCAVGGYELNHSERAAGGQLTCKFGSDPLKFGAAWTALNLVNVTPCSKLIRENHLNIELGNITAFLMVVLLNHQPSAS